MLAISRKLHESISLGDAIRIVIIEISRGRVRLGIEAPKDMLILREELLNSPKRDDVPRCENCKAVCDAGEVLCIDCKELADEIHF